MSKGPWVRLSPAQASAVAGRSVTRTAGPPQRPTGNPDRAAGGPMKPLRSPVQEQLHVVLDAIAKATGITDEEMLLVALIDYAASRGIALPNVSELPEAYRPSV